MDLGSDWLGVFQQYGSAMAKIGLAAVLGSLFGIEREWRGREAGLRTNMMVCIASCLFTYLGAEVFPFGDGIMRDPARIAAQVVSGVGFLGAGALLQDRDRVRGFTTAATIWLVAAIGMAAGAGAYFTAIFTTFIALVVLVVLAPISKWLESKAREQHERSRLIRKIQDTTGKLSETEEEELRSQRHRDAD